MSGKIATSHASKIYSSLSSKTTYIPIPASGNSYMYAWGRLSTPACTRLAVTVRVLNLVGIVLSTKVVVLFGTDTLGEHRTGQDTGCVLGQVVLVLVEIVVCVDERAALNAIAGLQALVDSVGEGVGHVRGILRCGSDGLSHPVSVGSDNLVVEVLHLVGRSTDRVGVRVVGTGRWAGGNSGRSWLSSGRDDQGGRGCDVAIGKDAGDDRRNGSD